MIPSQPPYQDDAAARPSSQPRSRESNRLAGMACRWRTLTMTPRPGITTIGPMRRGSAQVARHELEVDTVPRSRLLTLLMTAALVGACSAQGPSGAPQTSGPGGGQPTPTTGPEATQGGEATAAGGGATPAGGGGGGGAGGSNTAHFEVTSSLVNKSGDLPFVPGASVFGGDTNTSLSFSDATTADVLGVLITQGHVAVSYVSNSNGLTASASVCTSTNVQISATSASGSFDCQNADVLTTAGGIGKGEIKGTFSGSK